MHHHNFKIGLVVLLLFGLSSFYIVHYGFYPIALINGEIVLARDYYQIVNSGYVFYTSALATYQKVKLSVPDANKLYQDIVKASFDKLIEQKLIDQEFSLRKGALVKDLVDKTLSSIKNGNLKEPVAKLYGLTMPEFKKIILEPQAKRELLIEDFKAHQENFNDWLSSAKANVNLRILMPGLR